MIAGSGRAGILRGPEDVELELHAIDHRERAAALVAHPTPPRCQQRKRICSSGKVGASSAERSSSVRRPSTSRRVRRLERPHGTANAAAITQSTRPTSPTGEPSAPLATSTATTMTPIVSRCTANSTANIARNQLGMTSGIRWLGQRAFADTPALSAPRPARSQAAVIEPGGRGRTGRGRARRSRAAGRSGCRRGHRCGGSGRGGTPRCP